MKRILDWTIPYLKEHGSETPRLDAEVLLAFARKCPRIRLYTDYDQPLTNQQRSVMRDLVRRRANAEPVAYLVGHREFFSLDFEVGPGVFIPRPDTELLVMATLDAIQEIESPHVLELCSGSGCIPVSIAKNHATVQVTAIEREPIPFAFSQKNIKKHGVDQRVELIQGNLFEAVPKGRRFHVVVSNPPYVLSSVIPTLQADVRDHEPIAALDGGADGLDAIRHLVEQSPKHLHPGGWLMFELDPTIADASAALLKQHGYQQVEIKTDLAGEPRIAVGRVEGGERRVE
ncbi:MAG: peptide chain release factor N(5)-glutamine methyltransferase [Planctomycetaceae bacterium]|nr:peptide chain release factor N(5)-glutamine methyltransferase [Planctomycetaceae bacterium]